MRLSIFHQQWLFGGERIPNHVILEQRQILGFESVPQQSIDDGRKVDVLALVVQSLETQNNRRFQGFDRLNVVGGCCFEGVHGPARYERQMNRQKRVAVLEAVPDVVDAPKRFEARGGMGSRLLRRFLH